MDAGEGVGEGCRRVGEGLLVLKRALKVFGSLTDGKMEKWN